MGKGLRAAIVFEMAVLGAAILFLFLVVPRLSDRQGIVAMLLIMLAVVASGALFARLWYQTLRREEMVRRFYVSPSWIYNSEIGFAPIDEVLADGGAYGLVTFAATALATMSYGFVVADPPKDFAPRLVIDSIVFLFHGGGADDDEGVVIDEWKGLLYAVRSDASDESKLQNLGSFDNAQELARMLVASGLLAGYAS